MSDDEDENETFEDPDKIDPFGENPGWSECWVKAHRINYLGRVKKTVLSLFSIWNFFLDCQPCSIWTFQHCILGSGTQSLLL